MDEIQLGDEVKDVITGYQGAVVGITLWINQCRRLGVQGRGLDKDGKPLPIEWIDEVQCEIVKKQVFPAMEPASVAATHDKGGPMPTPARATDPT